METFFSQVPDKQASNFPVVIVGNKIDKGGRAVAEDAARKWSKTHGDMGYFEVSAKTKVGIDDAFLHIAKLIVKSTGTKEYFF